MVPNTAWHSCRYLLIYFAIAQIQQDQVDSYADRKGWDMLEAEKWLGPNIN